MRRRRCQTAPISGTGRYFSTKLTGVSTLGLSECFTLKFAFHFFKKNSMLNVLTFCVGYTVNIS